jgi:Subtilase family
VPVVGVPEQAGRSLVTALRNGDRAQLSLAPGGVATVGGGVAPFSSRGLAFGGRLKPDLVAPGVALLTSEPGENEDASPRFGSISGASAASAVAGAAAALLAEARPELDAASLKGALVGSARPLAGQAATAQGAGLIDVGAAAVAELVATPATLAFRRHAVGSWREVQTIRVSNVSTRRLWLTVRSRAANGVTLNVYPRRFQLRAGRTARVSLRASQPSVPDRPLAGWIEVASAGRQQLRVPWSAAPAVREAGLLTAVELTQDRFAPSDRAPSVLTFTAGRLVPSNGHYQVQAVSRLELELWRVGGSKPIGLLTRLRHLLPGHYAFGLTGRGPAGKVLRRGAYRLRLLAYPTGTGSPSRRSVEFRIA